MTNCSPVVIGVDVGTQGVRVMAVNGKGELLSPYARSFALLGSREEQAPEVWWNDMLACLSALVAQLKRMAGSELSIAAIAVTSTSGTMLPLDRDHMPLGPALMYSDPRSFAEATACKEAAQRYAGSGYTVFNASCGLPKILWFMNRFPHLAERIKLWAHAADYITGKLSGQWGVTDYTNGLKTGYDLVQDRWPSYISAELGVPADWLPGVVPPGTVIGSILPEVADRTGLPRDVKVVAGMTDGCASQLASGAVRPGDWSTTIGTTLVVKGVTCEPIADPLGRLYNHKHPEGYWMPGGASNTGADWVTRDYAGTDLHALNHAAQQLIPTPWIRYPLLQKSERFPFVAEEARGFEPAGLSPEQRFASGMEGVAYIERLSYELIEQLTGQPPATLYTAGGGSNSNVWLSIRSSVMRRPIHKMKHIEGAVGAAVLAASNTLFSGLGEAGRAMVVPDQVIEPLEASVCDRYEENYQLFKQRITELGYWQESERGRA
ncbi:FGGY-family carbohydrate kinase [Paenibacillus sp. HJGM_3]|uniref:FGGY-family carbohydrate kinase n=1 Tax=Paenibacillus sp. HJGM_3 TaxID=3379816 RepID=UPI003858DDC7